MTGVGMRDDPSGISSEGVVRAIEQNLPAIKSGLRNCFLEPPGPDAPVRETVRRAQHLNSEHMMHNFLDAVASCLAATLDGLAALPALLRIASPTVPIFAVGRAVTESSALAFWLLGPDVDPLERLRRGANQAIEGHGEMGRFIGEIQAAVQRLIRDVPLGSQTDPASQANIEDLLAWGVSVGLEVERRKRGRPAILGVDGVRRPTMMALVDHVLGASNDHHIPGTGQACYRVASAVTHSGWHSRAVLGQMPDGPASAFFDAPAVETTAYIVPFAVDAFCNAADAALTYFQASAPQTEIALRRLAMAVS